MKSIRKFMQDENAQINTSSVFTLFSFMVTVVLAVLIFGSIIYVHGMLANLFHDVGINNPQMGNWTTGVHNMTEAADITFGAMYQSAQSLYMVCAVYVLALAVSIVITNALVKMNPMWFFAYCLLSILAVIFAAPISNAYQALLANTDFYKLPGMAATQNGLTGFSVVNWIIVNFPTFILAGSVLGAVTLFINIIRTNSDESTFR